MPRVQDNKALNNKIRKLAPDAIEAMGEMLRDPNTPAPTRAQVIGFILERTLGKPDTTIHLMTEGASLKDSENRLIAIAEEIREETMDEDNSIPESDTGEEEPEEDDDDYADYEEDDESSEYDHIPE